MQEKRKAEPEFTITLDITDGIPFYKQIIHQVEFAIADGRLRTGDQLPTVRGLAVQLQINPNTVARAYSELEIRGIVSTQQGSGTFIGDQTVKTDDVDRERMLARVAGALIRRAASYGYGIREIIQYLQDLEGGGEA